MSAEFWSKLDAAGYQAMRFLLVAATVSVGICGAMPLGEEENMAQVPAAAAPPGNAAPARMLDQQSTIEELIAGLESDDINQWSRATTYLGMRGADARPAVPALVRALDRQSPRESALHTLAQLGPVAEEAVPALIKAITAYPQQPACRWTAVQALSNIGAAALPALKAASEDRDPTLRIWACAALVKSEGADSPSLRRLAEAIQKGDREALRAIQMLGPLAAPIVPQLRQAMGHSRIPQREFVEALGRIGPAAEPAMPEILQALKSRDETEKLEAIRAVNRIRGPAAREAIPLLIEALEAGAPIAAMHQSLIREEAARALGNFGPDARAAIPVFIKALDDPEERVRAEAVTAIKRIDPADPRALPGLIKAMRDPTFRVRYAANLALLKAGPVNIEVIRAFIRAVREDAQSFGEWREGRDYSGPAAHIIPTSEQFFSRLGPEHRYAVPDFAAMAKDPHSGVQRVAFEALSRIGEVPEEFLPVLLKHLPDYVAVNALKAMGPQAMEAAPELIALLKQGRRERQAAAEVLAAIGRPAADTAIPVIEHYIKEETQYPYLTSLSRSLLKLDPGSKAALDGCERVLEMAQKQAMDIYTAPEMHALLIQGGRGPEAHFRALTDALQDPTERVGGLAAELLLQCNAQGQARADALAFIFQEFEAGKDNWAVEVAARGLEFMGPKDQAYVPQLIGAISKPARRETARAVASAVTALGRIGPGAREALPQLKSLLKFTIPDVGKSDLFDDYLAYEAQPVRRAAAESIRKIEPAEAK